MAGLCLVFVLWEFGCSSCLVVWLYLLLCSLWFSGGY